jgi:hypothetical protein
MNGDIKTIQKGIEEIQRLADSAVASGETKDFMLMVAKVLDGMNYKLEKVGQEVLPGNAFIDPNDIPTRLR